MLYNKEVAIIFFDQERGRKMDMLRRQIYARIEQIYNNCAVSLINSVSDLVFGSYVEDTWCASQGCEKKMLSLKEIWDELQLVDLSYVDETSYGKALNAINCKLTILDLDNCDEVSYCEGLRAIRHQFAS